jgi:aminoglycoside phosphotransferase family enzyme/predicted kinase
VDAATLTQLCRPEAFDHPARDINLRETHISWVILSGEYAYKIKKPVNLGFLDFTTLERRQHFCHRELELNRRFSPELYLEVVAITRGPDGARFGGDGPVIEFAVKMRRFDESQLLDNIAARGDLDPTLIRSLGREFARLHDSLPACRPDTDSGDPGTPSALEAALEENFRQIADYPLAEMELRNLQTVRSWSRRRYRELLPFMEQRVANGCIIDGHGDAHLGNIALIDGRVRLFDCIEFNPDFRIFDSMGEIALLAMDLEARDHPREARLLLNDYLEYRGDYEGLAVLDLYRSYYALVRAKVNLLRETPGRTGLHDTEAYRETRRYLKLATRFCQPQTMFLAITHGVSGSGKSTVAGRILAECGAVRIRSDVERKRLYGMKPEERSAPGDEARLYAKEMTRKTFARLEQLSKLVISAGFPVIVDATFLHRAARQTFRDLASRLEVPFAVLDCVAPPEELRRRLIERDRHRHDASEADIEVMERQLERLEPLEDDELLRRVVADSGESGEELWGRLQEVLRSGDGPR